MSISDWSSDVCSSDLKSILAGHEGRKTDQRDSNAVIIRGCYCRRACYAPTHRESPGEPIFMPDAETALLLARLQFAFTISIHFIFPAFSIGLASYLMVLEALWLKTGRGVYANLFRYWLKIDRKSTRLNSSH